MANLNIMPGDIATVAGNKNISFTETADRRRAPKWMGESIGCGGGPQREHIYG